MLVVLALKNISFADDINVSELDNNSLLALQEAINIEIISRGLADIKTNILSGILVAGTDIPEGQYILLKNTYQ